MDTKKLYFYSGALDAPSIAKMKIPARRILRAAIFDNFRDDLTDEEALCLLPDYATQASLISICEKLGLLSCTMETFPSERSIKCRYYKCRVAFARRVVVKTMMKF